MIADHHAKEIQRKIISACFGESQYKRVAFLVPKDFRDYDNDPFKTCFQIIQQSQGRIDEIYHSGFPLSVVNHYGLQADYTHIERLALILIEWNVAKAIDQMLMNLMERTDDTVEIAAIIKTSTEVRGKDPIQLIDVLPDYLSAVLSDRLSGLVQERCRRIDNRLKSIKL